jgi:hypothetical protein
MVISNQVRQEMKNSSNDLLGSHSGYIDEIDDNNARMYVFYNKNDDSEDYPKIESTMRQQLGLYSNNHIQVHFVSGPEAAPPEISQRKPVPLTSLYPRFKSAKLRSVMERLYVSRLDNGKIGIFIPAEQTSYDGMDRESREEAEKRNLQRAYRQEDTNSMVRRELKDLLSLDSVRKENFVERTYESQDEIPSSYIPLNEYLKDLEKNVVNEGLEEEVEMEQPLVIGQPVMEEEPEPEAEPEQEESYETEAENEAPEEEQPEPEKPDMTDDEPEDEEEYFSEADAMADEEPDGPEVEPEPETEKAQEEPETEQEPEEPEKEAEAQQEPEPEPEPEEEQPEPEEEQPEPEQEPEPEEESREESPEPEAEKQSDHDGREIVNGVFYDPATRSLLFDREIDRSLVHQVMGDILSGGDQVDTIEIGSNCNLVHSDAFIPDANDITAPGLAHVSSLIIKDRKEELNQTGPWMDGLSRVGSVRIECGNDGIGNFTLEKGSFRYCEFTSQEFTAIPEKFMAGNLQEDLCVLSAAQITEIGNHAFNRINDREVSMANSKGEKKTYTIQELDSKNRDFHVWKLTEYNNINKMINNLNKETRDSIDVRVASETVALLYARDIVLGRASSEGGFRDATRNETIASYYKLFDAAKLFSEYPQLSGISERLALMDLSVALDIEKRVTRTMGNALKSEKEMSDFMARFKDVFRSVNEAGVTLMAYGFDVNTTARQASECLDSAFVRDYADKASVNRSFDKAHSMVGFDLFKSDNNGVKGIQTSWDMSKCQVGTGAFIAQKASFNKENGIGRLVDNGKAVRSRLVENCKYLDAVFSREIKELMAKKGDLQVAPDMSSKERSRQVGEIDKQIDLSQTRRSTLLDLKEYLEGKSSEGGERKFESYPWKDKKEGEYIYDLVANVVPNREGIGDMAFAFGRGPSIVEDNDQNKLYQRAKIENQQADVDKQISELDHQITTDKIELSRIPPSKQSRKDMEGLDVRIARLVAEVKLAEELAAARTIADPEKRKAALDSLRSRVDDVKASHAKDKNRPETVLERIVHENKSFADMVAADKAYLGLFAEIVGKLNGGVEFSGLAGDIGKLEALRTASEVSHGMDTSGLADISSICKTPQSKEDILNAWPELSSHIGRISRYSDEIAGMAKYNNAYAKNAYARTITSNHKTSSDPDPKPRTAVDLLLDGDLVKLQEWKDRIQTDRSRREALDRNLREAERLEQAIHEAETKIGNLKESKIALEQMWRKVDGHVVFGEGTHAFNFDPDRKQLHIDRMDGLPEGACYRYMRKMTKDGKDNPFLSTHVATGTICENGRFNDTCAYTELPRKKRGIPTQMLILNGAHATANLGRMAYGMLGGAVVSIFMPTKQVLRNNIINILKLPLLVANGLTGGIATRIKQNLVNKCLTANMEAEKANREAQNAGRPIPYPKLPYQLKQTRGKDGNAVYGLTPEIYFKLALATHAEKKQLKEEKKKSVEFTNSVTENQDRRIKRETRARNGGAVLGNSAANGPSPLKCMGKSRA